MERIAEQAFLYDFYGELLTERQKEFFDLYYNEDLSLAEIAENYGISRQGVRDVIVRAESVMTDIEDRTGLMRRFLRGRDALNAIEESAKMIEAINRHQYDNDQISEQTSAILASVKTLKE